jgi:hypothetical protein
MTNPSVSIPFAFAQLNAFQAAVTHSHSGLAKLDSTSTTDARCAPAIVSPNKDLMLALIIITTLMPLLSFTVMEITLHQTISLIAALMIAFVVATAPPPPLPVALAQTMPLAALCCRCCHH